MICAVAATSSCRTTSNYFVDTSTAALVEHVEHSEAKVVIVNMWATWCEPCKQELPDFVRLARAYREHGVEVLLVSGDFTEDRAEAEQFLRQLGVDFPSFRKNAPDEEWNKALNEEWSGTFPATFFYARGKQVRFLEGRVTYTALEREVLRLLGKDTE